MIPQLGDTGSGNPSVKKVLLDTHGKFITKFGSLGNGKW